MNIEITEHIAKNGNKYYRGNGKYLFEGTHNYPTRQNIEYHVLRVFGRDANPDSTHLNAMFRPGGAA